MLEAPRELVDRARFPLCEPPKALLLERLLELGETLRLPTLLPPVRFAFQPLLRRLWPTWSRLAASRAESFRSSVPSR